MILILVTIIYLLTCRKAKNIGDMNKIKNLLSFSKLLIVLMVMSSASIVGAKEKKPKGLILPEGDRAELVVGSDFSTITFPETLTAEEMELYNTDFVGYIQRINGKISSTGSDYKGSPIYFYLHNSKEWLYKGEFDSPAIMQVTKIKSIKISNSLMRLREFNKLMPLLDGSREKKNDTDYQNEVMSGENRYTFIDITLRD